MDVYKKTFGSPSIPKDQPKVGDLIKNITMTAVDNDYNKTIPKTTVVDNPLALKFLQGILFKHDRKALNREDEFQKNRFKIKKSQQEWISETQDNHRGHGYDAKTGAWTYDYTDGAFKGKQANGPFTMSRLAASTMCGNQYDCAMHTQNKSNYGRVPHHDEDESARAEVDPNNEQNRDHDFEGISIDIGQNEDQVGGKPQNRPIVSLLPTVYVPNNDILTGTSNQNTGIYYPKIISSSYIKKIKKREVDDVSK
jgi:hypothetical protein